MSTNIKPADNVVEVRLVVILILLALLQTLPLWNVSENLAGLPGDPFAHAALPDLYCKKILFWDLHADHLFAPMGADIGADFDSPFPMVLTCPLVGLSSHAKFHVFAFLQILLVALSALLCARAFIRRPLWQLAYVLLAWWTGFYFARVTVHYTLLSMLWGLQLSVWAMLTLDWSRWRSLALRGVALGLAFSGTLHNLSLLAPALVALLIDRALERNASVRRRVAGTALLFGLAGAIFAAFYMPMILKVLRGDVWRPDVGAEAYSLSWIAPFFPWRSNLLYSLFGVEPRFEHEVANSFDLAAMLLFGWALATRSFMRKRRRLLLAATAILCFIYALGPGANPVYALVSNIFPFSISRTPARFACVTGALMTILAFDFLQERWGEAKRGWWIAAGLAVWAVIAGPVLNQQIFVPVMKYREIFPIPALEKLKALAPTSVVVHIPVAISSDPTQNFMQLFHGQRISSGYMAYVSYTDKTLEHSQRDPLLSQLGCGGFPRLAFTNTPFMQDPVLVRKHMMYAEYNGVIVNKVYLSQPACQPLLNWVREMVSKNVLRVTEENPAFAVLGL